MKKIALTALTLSALFVGVATANAAIVPPEQATGGIQLLGGIYNPGANAIYGIRPFYQFNQKMNIGVLSMFQSSGGDMMFVPEAQFNMVTGSAFVPHLDLGAGYSKLASDKFVAEAGAGINYYFNPHFSVVADARVFTPDANTMLTGGISLTFGQ